LAFNVGVHYRLAQFWWAVSAKGFQPKANSEIESTLSEAEYGLFARFSTADQRHSYQVYKTLCKAGYAQPDLLKAGILHDIGKTIVSLSVWEKSLTVIGEKFFPKLLSSWGRGNLQGWKRPFVVRVQHPEWGARMAEDAGSSVLVVNLIRRHQDSLPENPAGLEEELLGLLQWADNQN
jgi:hypothetical protein